jgi:hypothetical protein
LIGGKGAFADWNEDFSSLLEAVRLGIDIDTGASDERAIALALIRMVVAKNNPLSPLSDPFKVALKRPTQKANS